MSKRIGIVLYDPHQPYYYPGSYVNGAVVVTTDEPKDYSRIDVKLYGRAHVHWTSSSGTGENRQTQSYSNNVIYILQTYFLWKKEDSPTGKLPMGVHTFPFQYQLPQDIPRSFESAIGQIRYEIMVEIVRSGLLKANYKASTLLNIGEHADLVRLYMEPQMCDTSSTVSCLCFNFGSVNMTCNVPRTGFNPGDTIPFGAHIENLTTKKVHIQTFLRSETTFTAHGGRTNIKRYHYFLLTHPPIQAGGIASLEGQSLQIPPDVPSTLRNCHCISIEYMLVIKALISFAPDVSLKIPIVIQHNE